MFASLIINAFVLINNSILRGFLLSQENKEENKQLHYKY